MGRRKKLVNNTDIPQHKIEAIARPLFCLFGLTLQPVAGMGGFVAIKENNKSKPVPDWE